jgi:hypothetical protein
MSNLGLVNPDKFDPINLLIPLSVIPCSGGQCKGNATLFFQNCETVFFKFLFCFVSAVLMIRKGVFESEMTETIQAQTDDNSPIRSYPSTLGQDLDEDTKEKLALFLVSFFIIRT